MKQNRVLQTLLSVMVTAVCVLLLIQFFGAAQPAWGSQEPALPAKAGSAGLMQPADFSLPVNERPSHDFYAIVATDSYTVYLPAILKAPKWEPVADSSWPPGAVALSLDVCHDGSDLHLFAGTDNSGLRYLTAGTWQAVGAVPGSSSITGVVFNETCDQVFVSAYTDGVWQGDYNGSSWSWQQLSSGQSVNETRAIVISNGRLFAGGSYGIHYWQSGWQSTNAPGSAAQPIMHLSVTDPVSNQGKLFAVQWLNGMVLQNAQPGTTPQTWTAVPGVSSAPATTMRAVFGAENNEIRTLGTSDAHYRFISSQWQLVRSASARAYLQVLGSEYVGYANNLGVYTAADSGFDIPANEGWPIPERVNALVAQDSQMYAATTSGVWKYLLP